MRAAFLIKSAKTPSSRIRVCDLAGGLSAAGITPDIIPLPEDKKERAALFRSLPKYDMVVLQKRLLSWLEWRLLRKNSRLLGFDFDDAIYLRNASPSERPSDYRSLSRALKFRRTVRGADFVVAANRTLASRALSAAPDKPVGIVPSSIDMAGIEPKRDYSLSSPPVVGWLGSRTTLRYLEHIAPSLRKLASERDFVLRIVADEGLSLDGVRTEFVPWTLDGQYKEAARFDVGIMPLSADPFSEGKAAYKLLQYMACGVPSVCSPVGMNAELADGWKCCLSAETGEKFAEKIGLLLGDAGLRESLGRGGRAVVEENFTTAAAAGMLAAFLAKQPKFK